MGRAGRLGPGICIRLWGSNEKIDTHTIPQIHREALEPLVLAAISCGYTNIQSLPFIEQPKQYAVSDAKNYLYAIGAICKNGMATPLGLQLFSLPIDHALGRLLIEGKAMKLLPSIIPLCSALSIRGRIFRSIEQDDDENIRKEHCDLQGLIRCIVADYPQQIYAQARKDGSEIAYRLARLWNVKSSIFPTDLQSIALCIMRAWPDCVHVRRRRGRRYTWSNGGTEKELSKNSSILAEKTELIIALGIFSSGTSSRERQSFIEYAMPVDKSWVARAGLGRLRLKKIVWEKGQLISRMERVYAGRVLETIEGTPKPALLPQALQTIFLQGKWQPENKKEALERYRIHGLARALRGESSLPSFEEYVHDICLELGLETAEDIELLDGTEFFPPQEDLQMQDRIEKEFPPKFSIGDAYYRLEYDVSRKRLHMIQTSGQRKTAPPVSMQPKKKGWTLFWVYKNRTFPL